MTHMKMKGALECIGSGMTSNSVILWETMKSRIQSTDQIAEEEMPSKPNTIARDRENGRDLPTADEHVQFVSCTCAIPFTQDWSERAQMD